ncbi:hypothetical protein H1C71_009210 [Ictidomys tridecemlineatus]|nr:hypothetical protein H1C71_009210 [Ictidomys tridecemlineatus]
MKAWSEEFEDYSFENINNYPIKRTSNIGGKMRTFKIIVCDFIYLELYIVELWTHVSKPTLFLFGTQIGLSINRFSTVVEIERQSWVVPINTLLFTKPKLLLCFPVQETFMYL